MLPTWEFVAQNYPSITKLKHFSCHRECNGYVILFWGVIHHVEPGISLRSTILKKLKDRLFHERSLVIFCLQNQVKTNKGNNSMQRIQDFGKWACSWAQVPAFWVVNKRLNSWAQHIVKEERRAQMVQDIWGPLTYSQKCCFEKPEAIAFLHDCKYCPFRSWLVCAFSTRIREEGKGVVLFTDKSPARNRSRAFPFPLILKRGFSSLMGPGSPTDINLSSKKTLLSTACRAAPRGWSALSPFSAILPRSLPWP